MTQRYSYTPNMLAQTKLGVKSGVYTGTSLTQLIMDAIGEGNYHRYIIAQDSFHGGRKSDEVTAIMNRDEVQAEIDKGGYGRLKTKCDFRSIGTIRKL